MIRFWPLFSRTPRRVYGAATMHLHRGRLLVIANWVFPAEAAQTRIGHGQPDVELTHRLCPKGSSDELIGAAVRYVLQSSPKREDLRVWNGDEIYDRDEPDKLARLFGMSSRRSLTGSLKLVSAVMDLGAITLRPSWKSRGDFLSYEPGVASVEDVQIPVTVSDAELGEAVRIAFARSSG